MSTINLPLNFLCRGLKAILRSSVKVIYYATYDSDNLVLYPKSNKETSAYGVISIPAKNDVDIAYDITEFGGYLQALKIGSIKGGLSIKVDDEGHLYDNEGVLLEDFTVIPTKFKLPVVDITQNTVSIENIQRLFDIVKSPDTSKGTYTVYKDDAYLSNPELTEISIIHLGNLGIPLFSIDQELFLAISNLKIKASVLMNKVLVLWSKLPGGYDIEVRLFLEPIQTTERKLVDTLDSLRQEVSGVLCSKAVLWLSELEEEDCEVDYVERNRYNGQRLRITKKQLKRISAYFDATTFNVSDKVLVFGDSNVTHYSTVYREVKKSK